MVRLVGVTPSRSPSRAALPRHGLRLPRPDARGAAARGRARARPRSPRRRSRRGRPAGCAPTRTPSAASASGGSTPRSRPTRSTSAAAGSTTTPAARWSSTGRRRPRGRSTRRRRPRRTASPCAAASAPRAATLTGISDEALDGSLADAGAVDDFLLEELDRARDARMRDIVATIQADQYHLIARDPEPPLVIQGGPGTGKTAVGLHRASFLLYAHRERLRRVLVVGPNPAFMEYVSHVLPTLGEDSVDQRAVAELVPGVELTRADPPDVQRLKADPRLAEVVQRAAALASAGEPQELVVRLEGRFVGVEADEVAELLDEARAELGLTAAARERFRMNVLRRFYEDYGVRLGGQAFRAFDEVERALRRDGRLTRFLDASWPAPKPEQVVRRLLASREPLAAAADGVLDEAEQRLLRRARSGWSEGDLPLLDEARAVLRRGADPLRARDRGRGAGPDADAAADGRAPGRRLVHAARRHRPGDRPGLVPPLAGAAAPPRRRRGRAGRGAAPRLPRAARDHGARPAAARADRARGRAADRLPRRRRAPAGRRGRRRARRPPSRRPPGSRARRACSR